MSRAEVTSAQPGAEEMTAAEQSLGIAHGAAYICMGLWPVIDLRSFAKVTGPKPEGWLVKAVGLLLVSIGAAMVRGARNNEGRSVATLGLGAAASLGGVALYNAARRRISPVYFVDAAFHLSVAAAWGIVLAARSRRTHSARPPAKGIRVAHTG